MNSHNLSLTEYEKNTLLVMLGLATASAKQINSQLAESFLRVTNAIVSQVGGTPYESLEDLDQKARKTSVAIVFDAGV